MTLLVVLSVAMVAGAATDDSGTHDPDPGSSGPAENKKEGEIYLATSDVSRTFSFQSLDRVSHYRINVVGEAPFELRAQRSASSFCLAGECLEMPDFDIAFFRETGGGTASVTDRHYNVGPEQGVVPGNANFAHVYLRTAGLTPDNLQGYAFVYLQGDPGGDVVPPWP